MKIGEWATCGNDTFLIVEIGDYSPGGSTYTDTGYYDLWYCGYLTYHCRKATQEEIESACEEMLNEIDKANP